MASSIGDLLTDRRYRFYLTVAFFLLSLSFLVLHFTTNPSTLPSLSSSSNDAVVVERHPQPTDPPPPSPPPPPPPPTPIAAPPVVVDQRREADAAATGDPIDDGDGDDEVLEIQWGICRVGKGVQAADYIPCLDNMKAIKELKTRRHMEHRERHCPRPAPRCLLPLPRGYRTPVPWPQSRDKIWYDNVPHQKLVEYKKDQNWMRRSGDYFEFPGGGTQFKWGVASYIQFIEKILPTIKWGKRTRVVLDVGCGVASFGGYLLDRDVITMSFAPKDEHEAQIQFALERGIPAFLSVIGTQKLTFPDNSFDMIHCARCRVHWDADGGRPLMELNRVLRPGGFFVWSATPVYRDDTRDQNVWNAMVALTDSICWKIVAKSTDGSGIGVVIYQKPISNSCYEERNVKQPPLCENYKSSISWYTRLDNCLPPIPLTNSDQQHNWPISWPDRLSKKPLEKPYSRYAEEPNSRYVEEKIYDDMKQWDTLVSTVYMHDLAINWSSIRNVMDMNAVFGGFAAALINQPLWVMNTVPVHEPDNLSVIFDRGLIGIYHDWCEAFNTYPRTYDLLHSSFLFGKLTKRCDIVEVVVEMDRILRPGGWILIQDTLEMIKKIHPVLKSLHWTTTLHNINFLLARKICGVLPIKDQRHDDRCLPASHRP